MPRLRLGLYRLPTVEIVVVQTIIRLSAQNLSFPWKLVEEPPFDALLVDGALIEDHLVEVERMAPAVLTVTRTHSKGTANTLERPIQAEQLQQWLSDTGKELLQARRWMPPPRHESSLSQELLESGRFKLRRWPPVFLMGRNEEDDSMVNLLWQRRMSASELADRCGQPVARCVEFLQALRSTGVLDVHVAAGVPEGTPLPRGAQHGARETWDPSHGFIGGLFRRLGIRPP